jgi:hypothetical protein
MVADPEGSGPSGSRSLGGSEPRPALLLAAFVVVAVGLTFRHFGAAATRIPGDAGDGLLNVWIMRAVQTGLPHGWHALWDAPIFYPSLNTLAFSDGLIPVALVDWPLRTMFGDALAFNVIYLGAWVLSSWCMYRLARRFVTYWGAALVAALAYTYAAVRLVHHEHFQLVVGGALVPLVLLLLLRCTDTPSPRRGTELGVAFAALTLTASYYGAMMGLFVVVIAAGSILAVSGLQRRTMLVALGIAAAVVFVLAAPIGIHYLLLERNATFRRPFAPAAASHLSDFLASGVHNYVLSHVPIIGHYSKQPQRGIENRLFPGIVATIFGIIGATAVIREVRRNGWRRPGTRELLLIAVAAAIVVVLSFGDWFRLAGHRVPLPFAWFRHTVPGFAGIRATSRLSLGGELALALFAAVGIDRCIRRRWQQRPDLAFAAAVALSAAVIAESAMTLFFVTVPTPHNDGGVNQALRALPAGVVLELPIESDANGYAWPFVEAPRQLVAIHDGDPRVNGYSGFQPPNFVGRAALLDRFPAQDAITEAQHIGVRYIILRTALVGTDLPADQLRHLNTDGIGRYTPTHARAIIRHLPPNTAVHTQHLPGGYLIQLTPNH